MTLPLRDTRSLDSVVEEYRQYQLRTRGLREQTLDSYERVVRLLLRESLGDDPIDPTRIRPSDVIEFVASMRSRWASGSMKVVRTALRSFFRYLRSTGRCDEVLEAAVPIVAYWKLATLPRCLSNTQLEQVVNALDVSKPGGYRDRAILLCLATLGLRPSEVAGLRLNDIDWRHGTIEVASRKNRRGAVLPLTREVGQAIASYLRKERPPTHERGLFLKHTGHRRGEPISRDTVYSVAVCAMRRAGIETPVGGAYVFRHTVASRMVQQGVSLKDVADVLGHRSIDITAIYAKVDLPALHEVASPWPEATP